MTRDEVQAGAVAAVLRRADEGEDGTIALVATGVGKTRIGLEVHRRRGGRALWLVHLNVLVEQARDACEGVLGFRPDVEADRETDERQTDVLIASVQSLARRERLARYRGDEFRTVVADEAHHVLGEQWGRVLGHFRSGFRVGLTATRRADGRGLDAWFSSLAYAYPLSRAIRDGVLVPVRRLEFVVYGVDFLRARRDSDTDEQTARKLMADPRWRGVQGWANPLRRRSEGRKVLTFVHGTRLADMLAERLRADAVDDDGAVVRGEPALAAHAKLGRDEMRRRLRAHARGEFRHLVVCQAVAEGYDDPGIGAIGMCAATSRPEVYQQRLGRGTRPAPGKTDLLMLDFVGASRHGLVTALDVFGEEGGSEEVRQLAAEEEARDPDAGCLTAWERGLKRAEALARANQERDREAAEEAVRSRIRARVRYLEADPEKDPLALVGVNRYAVAARRRRGVTGSERTAEAIRRFRAPVPSDPAEAAALLTALVARAKKGLSTFRQAAWLAKLGLPSEVSFSQARALLDAVKSAGGRKPPEHVVASVLEECGGLEDDAEVTRAS
jgi:superfamily II DNA or RNA helicase